MKKAITNKLNSIAYKVYYANGLLEAIFKTDFTISERILVMSVFFGSIFLAGLISINLARFLITL